MRLIGTNPWIMDNGVQIFDLGVAPTKMINAVTSSTMKDDGLLLYHTKEHIPCDLLLEFQQFCEHTRPS